MIISQVFKVIQGHQITDEELYMAEGNIPVYTGKNDIKGYWDKEILTDEDYLPCITYPTKANSGEAYVQIEKFDANNTALLIPKPEWKNKVDLKWFSYKLPHLFLKIQTSKEGVSYLNKEIVEETDILIPDKKIQNAELIKFEKLNRLKSKLNNVKLLINNFLDKSLILENNYDEEIPLSNLLKHISRNDSLSEEGLYKKSDHLEKDKTKIKVLSGSIEGFYGYYPKDKSIHLIEEKCCLQVVTRGKAGLLRFLKKGNYATNTNSMLLIMNEEIKAKINIKNELDEEIYLKFMEVFLHPYFKDYSSSADLSVFPLTVAIKNINIPLIKLNKKMRTIVLKYEEIKTKKKQIELTISKINELLVKEIKY